MKRGAKTIQVVAIVVCGLAVLVFWGPIILAIIGASLAAFWVPIAIVLVFWFVGHSQRKPREPKKPKPDEKIDPKDYPF
jgi:hypothetical protein